MAEWMAGTTHARKHARLHAGGKGLGDIRCCAAPWPTHELNGVHAVVLIGRRPVMLNRFGRHTAQEQRLRVHGGQCARAGAQAGAEGGRGGGNSRSSPLWHGALQFTIKVGMNQRCHPCMPISIITPACPIGGSSNKIARRGNGAEDDHIAVFMKTAWSM